MVVQWDGSEPLTHCHQWIVLRTKLVQCKMKLQRRNIKQRFDLKAASVLDIATEYVDQKQLKSSWTWKTLTMKVVSHEAGPGVLSLKWYAVRKQIRVPTWLHLPALNWSAASCELWVEMVYMWCGLKCQTFSSPITMMELFLVTFIFWLFNHLTWLVVWEFSLAFSYHWRFRLCLCRYLCQDWHRGWSQN